MRTSASSLHMVGRAAVVQQLNEVYEATQSGTAVGVLVSGEAGIGKTRLLEEFLAGLPPEVVVARGQCWDMGSPGTPFAPVRGLLRDLVAHFGPQTVLEAAGPAQRWLTSLVPELQPLRSSLPAEVDRELLHDVVVQVLTTLSVQGPLAVVVEDLHWADAATLDLLRAVVNTVRPARLMFLLSYRTEDLARSIPLRSLAVDLDRKGGLIQVELARLSAGEVSELTRWITGETPASERLQLLLERSEGVPFFVEELLGMASPDGGLPRSLRDLLLARYLHLSESTQEVVRLLAAGGTRVEHVLVSRVRGADPAQFESAVREAVTAQVMSTDGTAYTFRHALLREAVYEELLPAERLRVHARYAVALAGGKDSTDRASEIAHHWRSAQRFPEALAATVGAAAHARARGAFGTAGRLGEQAQQLWSLVPDARTVAACERVDLLMSTIDDYIEAEDPRTLAIVERALAECPREDHRQRALLLHEAMVFRSDSGLPGGLELMEQAVALLPEEGEVQDDLVRLKVMCGWGLTLMHADAPRAREVLEETADLGRRLVAVEHPHDQAVRVRSELARALTNLGTLRSMLGDVEGAFAAFDEALELAGDEPRARLRDAYWRGILLSELGRFDEAAVVAQDGAALARATGLEATWGAERALGAVVGQMGLGNLTAAESLLEQVEAQVRAPYERAYAAAARIELLLWRDELEAAQRLHDEASEVLEQVRKDDIDDDLELSRVVGQLALARGDLETAWEAATTIWSVDELQHGPVYGVIALGAAVLAQFRGRRADPPGMSSSEAERRLRSSLASVSGWDVADTWRVLVEAELSGSTGSGPEPAAWEAAVGAAAGGRLGVHHHVYALYRLAQAQIAAGERLLAGSTLERAARLGQDKGLVRLVRLVEELSVRAGLDHNTRRTAKPYGSQLTSREQQVLALLAQGLTNRQIGRRLFISDKTASVHVSAIIRKLGVANRTDAAVRAAGLGLVTGRDEPAG